MPIVGVLGKNSHFGARPLLAYTVSACILILIQWLGLLPARPRLDRGLREYRSSVIMSHTKKYAVALVAANSKITHLCATRLSLAEASEWLESHQRAPSPDGQPCILLQPISAWKEDRK